MKELMVKNCVDSPAAGNDAVRMVCDPECAVICTVDGERVDRSEIMSDGTGILFYRCAVLIPVSVALRQPDQGKYPEEPPVAEIAFRRC